MRLVLLLCVSLLWGSCAYAADTRSAIFAGGNFWTLQAMFDRVSGVTGTSVGYIGGKIPNPVYSQVISGESGHREAVAVVYDPALISYAALLAVYWHAIDPIDAGGQFKDRGFPFTTAIYYRDETERRIAIDSKMLMDADNNRFEGKPIATQIIKATPFYAAEEYLQSYYRKNPLRYRFFENRSGRQQRLYEIWGDLAQ